MDKLLLRSANYPACHLLYFGLTGGYDPISRAPNRISVCRACGEYLMLTLFARLQYTYYGQGGRGDAEAAINITWFCGKGMSRFEVHIASLEDAFPRALERD